MDHRDRQPQPMAHPPHLPPAPAGIQHERAAHQQGRSAASTSPRPAPSNASAMNALPFSLRRPFRPNQSSTSLVSSTAEGRPIPVDGSTVENRTSALRELNHNYPSRHRYAKSTGAQSSTYSEPVIVRSYNPRPGRPVNTSRAAGIIIPNTSPSGAGGPRKSSAASRRTLPFADKISSTRHGMLGKIVRGGGKMPWGPSAAPEEAKLPPVDAFTFKSFMANIEAEEGGDGDINADLDRIAEICARSRYSLSNQYEVHYAPHGSGSSFMENQPGNQDGQGPTLQAVSSDDEQNMRRQRRRRHDGRRDSRAMGTLETIMSSSRSSDEDKSKKRSAAEIAEEVRGRAVWKESGDSSPVSAGKESPVGARSENDGSPVKRHRRRKSASLALIDGSKQVATATGSESPRASAASLVGEPALPQTSSSQLEIRTAPEDPSSNISRQNKDGNSTTRSGEPDLPIAQGAMIVPEEPFAGTSLVTALSGWMSWRTGDSSGKPPGRAEGSLRELLKTADIKGVGHSAQGSA